jgi:hypothetical protein
VPEFDEPFLRELIRPPFRIVYRRDPEHVPVVRVWRSERLREIDDEAATSLLNQLSSALGLSSFLPLSISVGHGDGSDAALIVW